MELRMEEAQVQDVRQKDKDGKISTTVEFAEFKNNRRNVVRVKFPGDISLYVPGMKVSVDFSVNGSVISGLNFFEFDADNSEGKSKSGTRGGDK